MFTYKEITKESFLSDPIWTEMDVVIASLPFTFTAEEITSHGQRNFLLAPFVK